MDFWSPSIESSQWVCLLTVMSNPLLWSAFSTEASVLSVMIWSITHSVDSFSGEYVRISNCGFFEISLWLVKGIFC